MGSRADNNVFEITSASGSGMGSGAKHPPEPPAKGYPQRYFGFGLNGRIKFIPSRLAKDLVARWDLRRTPEQPMRFFIRTENGWEPLPKTYLEKDAIRLLGIESTMRRVNEAVRIAWRLFPVIEPDTP